MRRSPCLPNPAAAPRAAGLPQRGPGAAGARVATWQLFAIAVLVWGTTWHAIVYQIDLMPPEAGVAWRFALAGALVLGVSLLRGQTLALSLRAHGRLALQGALMYSLAYLAVYHAERHVASGLVAVGYSASPLLNGIGAWLLWRTPLSRRFLVGGVIAAAGVALIFAPELAAAWQPRGDGRSAAWGALLTVLAVVLSSAGNLLATRNGEGGLPFWPALGFGMLWGALLSLLVALLAGQSLRPPSAVSWWLSLAYLAVAGSVLAFACFLTLQQRVGPGRASTIGAMTPVLALVVSAVFEAYRPGPAALAGAGLALWGNAWMLRRPRG